MVGIYKITNPEGKIYIGQSIDIEKRFRSYKRLNCKKQRKLFFSLKKYGCEKHIFKILEECNKEDLNRKEIYWISYYNSIDRGLNLASGGEGGGTPSEETKKRMSLSAMGKKWSNEAKLKYIESKTNHPMYNDEWRSKISKANKGRKITWANKISQSKSGKTSPFKGKKHSEETKKKMSQHRKNNYKSNHLKTPVLQFDLNSNFIKEWDSITCAKKMIGGDIASCVIGKQKTAGGFIWKYKNL